MISLRRSTVLADVRQGYGRRRQAATTVGGDDLGDFYKDDNGSLWKYDVKAGYPAGYVRAMTDQYGGSTSPWFDRPVLPGSDHDEVNAWIDRKALILGAIETAAEKAGEAAAKKSKTAPKPTGGAGGGGSSGGYSPPETDSDVAPYAASAGSTSSLSTAITVAIIASAGIVFLFAH
jgi:hypothetical protein